MSRRASVALATCAALPAEFDDDELFARALRERAVDASFQVWDDPTVDWQRFDLVVVRSTWDYTRRRAAFVSWAESLGDLLRNPPALIRWNSDKRYLSDLSEAGIGVVPTRYVAPGDPPPTLDGEVVVKPTVSAGGRDTGRFGAAVHGEARALLERILASGRTAMVQPYLNSVDACGETALVFVAGRLTHVLRKRAVLRPDQVAPVRDDGFGAAEAMYDLDLVGAGEAGDREVALGERVTAALARRFGTAPLYTRVDLLADRAGEPRVLELEAVEPCLYLQMAPAAAERLADAAIVALR